MAHYVTLIRFTQQGIQGAKQIPERLKGRDAIIAKEGGKPVGEYLTMGQYDAVLITEFPNDEAVARAMLTLGMTGNIQTTTMRAFTRPEAEAIARSLG